MGLVDHVFGCDLQILQLKHLSICFAGLIDYNFHCFRQAISEVCRILACPCAGLPLSHTRQRRLPPGIHFFVKN